MKLRTKHERIDEIVSWLKANKDGLWLDVRQELDNLPDSPTAKQLIDITEDDGHLIQTICNECKEDVDAVIEIGEEMNHDSRTVWVCGDCLVKAVEMLEQDNDQP